MVCVKSLGKESEVLGRERVGFDDVGRSIYNGIE